ncbi:hypothetical protein MFLAVUS_008199 [Mucor flavus]|uniref:Uncharacterized protein n=1 Tax=Mucor flavus TaxID=439312 RepID=A0ABP9Z6F2_9FUNG
MMENRTESPMLSLISGSLPNSNSSKTGDGLESTLQHLLEKNTALTSQLEKAFIKISRLRKQRSVLLDVIVKVNTNDEAYNDDDDVDDDIDISSDLSDDDCSQEKKEVIIEPVTKRRKVQPKRQRGTKPIQVPKDESVGYSIQRTYKSMVNEDAFTNYTCSIDKDPFDKPIFCIQAEDAPDIIIQKNTPTAAWSEVLKRSNELRKKEFKNTVSGPEYYGLSFATIKKMIQELPGADECLGYQWVDI